MFIERGGGEEWGLPTALAGGGGATEADPATGGAERGLVLIKLVAGVEAVAGIVTRERLACAP